MQTANPPLRSLVNGHSAAALSASTSKALLYQITCDDLRHPFICRRVLQWHRQGVTIDSAMVALSTYVRHAKASDTYWYLTGVPELLAIAGRNFEQFASKSKEGGRA